MTKQPKPCLFCNGESRKVCFVCGWQKPKSKKNVPLYKLTEKEQFQIHCDKIKAAYLKELWDKLRATQQQSTGVESVDKEIEEMYGSWIYKWF